jgi:hypothetical protein
MQSIALTPDEATNVVSQLPPMTDIARGYYDPGAGLLFFADHLAGAVQAADKTRYVAPVPVQIRADQARIEMILRGKGAAVDAFIAALPDPDKSVLAAIWEYRISFLRTDPQFLRLLEGAGVGPATAQVDAFFVAAATR